MGRSYGSNGAERHAKAARGDGNDEAAISGDGRAIRDGGAAGWLVDALPQTAASVCCSAAFYSLDQLTGHEPKRTTCGQ